MNFKREKSKKGFILLGFFLMVSGINFSQCANKGSSAKKNVIVHKPRPRANSKGLASQQKWFSVQLAIRKQSCTERELTLRREWENLHPEIIKMNEVDRASEIRTKIQEFQARLSELNKKKMPYVDDFEKLIIEIYAMALYLEQNAATVPMRTSWGIIQISIPDDNPFDALPSINNINTIYVNSQSPKADIYHLSNSLEAYLDALNLLFM